MEKSVKSDSYKINIHNSILPLAEGEEIVDVLPTKSSLTWNHILLILSFTVILIIQIIELVLYKPLSYLQYPLLLFYCGVTQTSLRRIVVIPLLITTILQSIFFSYFFLAIKAATLLACFSLSMYVYIYIYIILSLS